MPLHIGAALKDFINKSKHKSGLRAVQIDDIWENLMGKTIAHYTDKIEIVNRTLIIYTSAGALKHELVYQKAKIVERVNEAFDEDVITEVVIR